MNYCEPPKSGEGVTASAGKAIPFFIAAQNCKIISPSHKSGTPRNEESRTFYDDINYRRGFSENERFFDRLYLSLTGVFVLLMWCAITGVDQAFGAEKATGGSLADFGWRLLNFAILAGVLFYFGASKVKNFFADRKIQVAKAVEEAQRARKEAESKYHEVMFKLAAADEEIAALTRSIELQGQHERERILAEAEAATRRIIEEARTRMDHNLTLARQQLQAEAAELALALAERLLRERITPEDQDNMLNEVILKMKRQETLTGTGTRNEMI